MEQPSRSDGSISQWKESSFLVDARDCFKWCPAQWTQSTSSKPAVAYYWSHRMILHWKLWSVVGIRSLLRCRTDHRIWSPKLVLLADSWMCGWGKSATWMRNFGISIGSCVKASWSRFRCFAYCSWTAGDSTLRGLVSGRLLSWYSLGLEYQRSTDWRSRTVTVQWNLTV